MSTSMPETPNTKKRKPTESPGKDNAPSSSTSKDRLSRKEKKRARKAQRTAQEELAAAKAATGPPEEKKDDKDKGEEEGPDAEEEAEEEVDEEMKDPEDEEEEEDDDDDQPQLPSSDWGVVAFPPDQEFDRIWLDKSEAAQIERKDFEWPFEDLVTNPWFYLRYNDGKLGSLQERQAQQTAIAQAKGKGILVACAGISKTDDKKKICREAIGRILGRAPDGIAMQDMAGPWWFIPLGREEASLLLQEKAIIHRQRKTVVVFRELPLNVTTIKYLTEKVEPQQAQKLVKGLKKDPVWSELVEDIFFQPEGTGQYDVLVFKFKTPEDAARRALIRQEVVAGSVRVRIMEEACPICHTPGHGAQRDLCPMNASFKKLVGSWPSLKVGEAAKG